MSETPFPFVGAGDATCFEWAHVHVCFERTPTRAEASAVSRRLPVPLRARVEWDGPVLWAGSEQGVGRVINATYGKRKRPVSTLTTRTRFTTPASAALARFNADLEGWLSYAHRQVPILVAYRPEDAESGGTTTSDWHRRSVTALPAVLAKLARLARAVPAAAALGVSLSREAAATMIPVDARLVNQLVAREKEGEAEAPVDPRYDWDTLAAVARKALGRPAPVFRARREAGELEPALTRLETALPQTAKRLRRLARKGLSVRAGASPRAIAAAEKTMGFTLAPAHRALLEAFDGGQVGAITFLGTAAGGAVRDAELATFVRAWCGLDLSSVVVAHMSRHHAIALPRGKAGPARLLQGQAGWGGGQILRECRSLDTALELALKTGTIAVTG